MNAREETLEYIKRRCEITGKISELCEDCVDVAILKTKKEIIKDIRCARQCMDFKGIRCDNKDCLNKYCPLWGCEEK